MTTSKRALLSCWNKRGLVRLARALAEADWELLASGGTAAALQKAGLEVVAVESVTGFPQILSGRVKTLHPAIHGGILARDNDEDRGELARHKLAPISLVVCNLYPFVEARRQGRSDEAELVELIDIGGVALLRAAAKNFDRVTTLSDPDDYPWAIETLEQGQLFGRANRRALAQKAFAQTAALDDAIASWMREGTDPSVPGPVQTEDDSAAPGLPRQLLLSATRGEALRYGENPHQQGARYLWVGSTEPFEMVGGSKGLSYNNFADLDAAWAAASGFEEPAAAVIKHANPCGLATADSVEEALRLARESDPVSAFGSIIAFNRPVDRALVESLGDLFVEVLVAPAFDDEALAWLSERKKSCRAVRVDPGAARPDLQIRSIASGLLVQTHDEAPDDPAGWEVVTARAPTDAERRALRFAWRAVRYVKSNAIVFARGQATVGVGAGQTNRLEAVNLAARQAGERAKGAVCASDAFFPFADGLERAAEAGVTAVIQPGGSRRDEEVIEAANRLTMAMIMTGRRHFRH